MGTLKWKYEVGVEGRAGRTTWISDIVIFDDFKEAVGYMKKKPGSYLDRYRWEDGVKKLQRYKKENI